MLWLQDFGDIFVPPKKQSHARGQVDNLELILGGDPFAEGVAKKSVEVGVAAHLGHTGETSDEFLGGIEDRW